MKNIFTFIFSLFVLLFAVFVSAEAQTNATIPYSCNFETTSDYTNWVIPTASPSPTNRWYIGNATNSTLSTGSRAAYISNNSGTSAAYTVTAQSISSIYRQFNTVAGEKYEITFDAKVGGEAFTDMLYIYWVDNTTISSAVDGWVLANSYGWPTAGEPYAIGAVGLIGPSDWTKQSITVMGNGSPAKLVFFWTNNPNTGTQPGACIDNVEVKKITVSPANIPYYCEFENKAERDQWIIPSSPTVNKWTFGTAEYSVLSPSYSAYISNTFGLSASYTNTATNVLPIYREFNTVDGANYRIYFDVMVAGEKVGSNIYDFLQIYWVTDPSVPVSSWASTTYANPPNSTPYAITYFQENVVAWRTYYFDVVGNGSPSKLVFAWYNNNTSGTNPGGCIDNIRIVDNGKKYDNSIWVNKDTPYSSYTPEKLVKDVFVQGGDCAITNVKFTGWGWNDATKTWTGTADKRSLAYFDHGTLSGLGMTDGLLMTTGYAKEAEGPNVNQQGIAGGNTTGILDADLGTLVGISNIKTISILEFDFVPGTSTISFDYIFASEEYPEFSCENYNDVFGFFISGPGITGNKNIAIIPGTPNTPVSIANLHAATTHPYSIQPCNNVNAQYYVDGTQNLYTEFDGHTKMLTTMAQTVQPGQTYHLKLAVANVGDDGVGSGVFLRAGSLDLGLGLSNKSDELDDMNNVFEGCGTNQFVLKLNPTGSNINVALSYSGTAVGCITKPDVTAMPSSVIIPAGTSTYPIPYIVSSSCSTNGGYVIITATFTDCGTPVTLKDTIYVYKKVNPTVSYTTACGATSALVTFGVPTGQGTPKVKFKIDTESTWHPINGYSNTFSVGTHTMHIQDSVSCIYDVNFVVNPRPIAYGTDPQTACEKFTWINGVTYTSSTSTPTCTISGGAKNGCDSIVTLNLTIKKNTYYTDIQSKCESYTWINGTTYTSSNNTAQCTIPNKAGCDSIITLNLTIKKNTYYTDIQSKCESYTWINGTTYTSSNNTAQCTIPNKAGCDSIVTLNLTINHPVNGVDTKTACVSHTWIDGIEYTESTNTPTYTITKGAKNGCDSIVTLNLTIDNVVHGTDIKNECVSYTWIDGFTYYASTNMPEYTIPNGSSKGCDSIVTLNLTINQPVNGVDTKTACVSYIWIDGIEYTESTNTPTYTITKGAKNGCDSIVTLNLTIDNVVYGTDIKNECVSYTWIDGFTYYASTNMPEYTIPNGSSKGCDSIVTLNLTINNIVYGIDTKNECDNYTWIDGINYTSNNNTATHTITNGSSAGCDSIVTLNLTIKNKTYGIDTQTAVGSFEWIDGNIYTESNNTATHTIPNGASNGCDSVVTLNLTINNTQYGIDTQVACDSYKWIDGNTYTSSTNTPTYTIPNGSSVGSDSIVLLNLTVNYTTYAVDTKVVCDSYTWIDGVEYTSSNSTATHTVPNKAGCDSIITLNLIINNKTYGIDTKTACGSYKWIDGNTYNESNSTATHTIPNKAGCDSIVTLNLTVNDITYGTDVIIACNSYEWNGIKYTSSTNTPTHTIPNGSLNGCDSIVSLDLTIINNSVSIEISEPICADDGVFSLKLTPETGAVLPTNYKIDFVEKALPPDFVNFTNQQGTVNSNVITVQMPEKLYPDTYSCTVVLSNDMSDCEGKSYQINYAVLYPSSIMEQKWNDVIALLNEQYSGYKFAGYQWYHNGQEMLGETQSYIYIKNGNLVEGENYYVLITREDGSQSFSCNYTAKAPKVCCSDYPTVVNGGETIQIQIQNKTATVRLITVTGIVLSSKTVNSGDEIVAPVQQGVYILEILSGNNTREVVKIIVK